MAELIENFSPKSRQRSWHVFRCQYGGMLRARPHGHKKDFG